ncbi:hypothetical protein BJ742DRAFT_782993 [Cladochytrium replicatum]|nr:hypothetical protein BJ742DRAFT_782993 [Cladochytrium replicatum]
MRWTNLSHFTSRILHHQPATYGWTYLPSLPGTPVPEHARFAWVPDSVNQADRLRRPSFMSSLPRAPPSDPLLCQHLTDGAPLTTNRRQEAPGADPHSILSHLSQNQMLHHHHRFPRISKNANQCRRARTGPRRDHRDLPDQSLNAESDRRNLRFRRRRSARVRRLGL